MSFRHHRTGSRYNTPPPKSPSHHPSPSHNTSFSSSQPLANPATRHFHYSTEHLTAVPAPQPPTIHMSGNSVKTSATCSLASSRESSTSNPGQQSYR